MAQSDGIVRWSPNPTREEFMIINTHHRTIELYGGKVPAKSKESDDFTKLAQHSECPQLTSYDWSPTINGLVALGTPRGEVHLLRVDDNANAALILPLRLGRSCQAVAFNTLGHLAVGLDRVRNDMCLQIWDLNQRLANWDQSKKGWQGVPATGEPIFKTEPSLSITSIKFFEDQPKTLVVGIKNQGVRIHDIRDPGGAVTTFQTRCNNNLAIDYADTNYFASSSLDDSNVLVWDRRATSRNVASAPYNESVDSGELPWGAALKISNAIETTDPKAHAQIKKLRYFRDHRGYLGVLSTSGQLRIFNTVRENTDTDAYSKEVDGSPELLRIKGAYTLENSSLGVSTPKRTFEKRLVSFDWVALPAKGITPRLVALRADNKMEVLKLPNTAPLQSIGGRPAQPEMARLPSQGLLLQGADLNARLEEVTLDAAKTKAASYQKPHTASLSSIKSNGTHSRKSSLTRPPPSGSPVKAPKRNDSKRSLQFNGVGPDSLPVASKKTLSSREQHELLLSSHDKSKTSRTGKKSMLARIKAGYLFDCEKNKEIVADDPWLEDVWSCVSGAEEASADDGLVTGPLDLSYLGVQSIWNNDLGRNPEARFVDDEISIPEAPDWEQLIGQINQRCGLEEAGPVSTAKPNHRTLCLAICRWGRGTHDLESSLSELVEQGEYSKAAAKALFYDRPDRTVEILKKAGPDLMFLAMGVDFQMKNGWKLKLDGSDWADALRDNTRLSQDPYLRAVYALVSTGDWKAVANEKSLPMRARVAVALRNFTDADLTTWLAANVAECKETGDIEGILLTGITDDFVTILEKYIAKFADVQTAVLLLSFCAPRYITDLRFKRWRDEYRAFFNVNHLFIDRCKFDAASARKSRRRDGSTVLTPPPRQVTLRCGNCSNDISHTAAPRSSQIPPFTQPHTSSFHGPGTASPSTSVPPVKPELRNPLTSSMQNAGISCSKCGKHLPRCAVCMLHLGIPRSDRPELNSEAGRKLRGFFSFCLKCRHGVHADHGQRWFEMHTECPEPECRCRCSLDGGGMGVGGVGT